MHIFVLHCKTWKGRGALVQLSNLKIHNEVDMSGYYQERSFRTLSFLRVMLHVVTMGSSYKPSNSKRGATSIAIAWREAPALATRFPPSRNSEIRVVESASHPIPLPFLARPVREIHVRLGGYRETRQRTTAVVETDNLDCCSCWLHVAVCLARLGQLVPILPIADIFHPCH